VFLITSPRRHYANWTNVIYDLLRYGLASYNLMYQVRALTGLQGGSDRGLICCTITRALMTNGLMSRFSRTGQKGKFPFSQRTVFCDCRQYVLALIIMGAKQIVESRWGRGRVSADAAAVAATSNVLIATTTL